KIAEPLNRYIRKLHDNSVPLPEAGLAVLQDAVNAIQQVIDHFDADTGFFASHDGIIARLSDLEHALDAEISRLAETVDIGGTAEVLLLDADAGATIVRPALRGTGADGATVEVPLVHEDAATDVFEHDSFPAPAVAAANVASRDDASQDSAANAAMQDDDVIELDPVDPTALETMNWSFEHFPEQQAATEPE